MKTLFRTLSLTLAAATLAGIAVAAKPETDKGAAKPTTVTTTLAKHMGGKKHHKKRHHKSKKVMKKKATGMSMPKKAPAK